MDLKEIEERWRDKHWFPINPHKDIGWLISHAKELEASDKKLREAIERHRDTVTSWHTDMFPEDEELYKALEE